MRRNALRGPGAQTGATAVAFIILSVLLLGMAGLALDAGRLYVSKAELQNSADACALAAAAALTGANADQLTVAENYGLTVAQRNLLGMQETASDATTVVSFSETLDGVYREEIADPAERLRMRYALCTVTETGIVPILVHVINALPGGGTIGAGLVRASAVASLEPSISHCALPLGICKQGPAPTFGFTRGQWLEGRLEAGGGINGAFKWLRYPGYTRVQDLAGLIAGSGQCDLNASSTVQSHSGQIDSLLTAWNTRLGIYRPGGRTVSEAPPDLSGWVFDRVTWPTQSDAMTDFLSKRAAIPVENRYGNVSLPNPNDWASADDFALYGSDRRLVVGPILDCNNLASNGTAVIEEWACYLILHPVFKPGDTMLLEYRGLGSDLASGCVTSGLPGGPGAGGPKVPALVQ